MDPNSLRDQLAKLQEELRRANHVDSHSSRLLGEVMDDIKRLIERTSDTAAPPVSTDAMSLHDRLERIAVQFEADHPTLAASSRRLVDLLGKVGL
jgi:Domain of unknown function (DUF4404)